MFLSVQQVADRLAVKKQTVYRMCERRLLKSYRFGIGRGTVRIDEDDLKEFLNRSGPAVGFQHSAEQIRAEKQSKQPKGNYATV